MQHFTASLPDPCLIPDACAQQLLLLADDILHEFPPEQAEVSVNVDHLALLGIDDETPMPG
jgi:hypothetical protein